MSKSNKKRGKYTYLAEKWKTIGIIALVIAAAMGWSSGGYINPRFGIFIEQPKESELPPFTVVPKVIDKDPDEAHTLLKQLRFEPMVQDVIDGEVKKVINQTPDPGIIAEWGQRVYMVYSLPKDKVAITATNERVDEKLLQLQGNVSLEQGEQEERVILVLLEKDGKYQVIDIIRPTESGAWRSTIPENQIPQMDTFNIVVVLANETLPKGKVIEPAELSVAPRLLLDKSQIIVEKAKAPSIVDVDLVGSKYEYRIGDTVAIIGNVTKIIPNVHVIIKVTSPTGSVTTSEEKISSDGSFRHLFGLGESATVGSYTVVVYYDGHKASTAFKLRP